MRISVCVAATRPATLRAAVHSVCAQSWQDWELLVLGQGDEARLAGTVQEAAGDDVRVRYTHLLGRGLSRARNRAMSLITGDVVAFTDDDCQAAPDWLKAIAGGFRDHPEVGLVAGPVTAPPLPARWPPATCPVIDPTEALYDPFTCDRTPPPGWDWMGANFAIRADVAAGIGRWDECLGAGSAFPAGEDTDYKLRLEAAGVPMLTLPAARVLHAGGMRVGIMSVLRSQYAYATGKRGPGREADAGWRPARCDLVGGDETAMSSEPHQGAAARPPAGQPAPDVVLRGGVSPMPPQLHAGRRRSPA